MGRLWANFGRLAHSLQNVHSRRVLRFDSGKAAEGCGIALRAMSLKSALRDLL